jgi:photosystem II stability/assembly factor-like uncharacterized protein
VIDVSVERSDPSHAVALTKTAVSGGYHVILAESLDNGQTWTQAGIPLASDLFPVTVDIAPSTPERMYVSGLAGSALTPVIERSDDRGMSGQSPAHLNTQKRPHLAAVDPERP